MYRGLTETFIPLIEFCSFSIIDKSTEEILLNLNKNWIVK